MNKYDEILGNPNLSIDYEGYLRIDTGNRYMYLEEQDLLDILTHMKEKQIEISLLGDIA